MNYITLHELQSKLKTQGAKEVFIDEGIDITYLNPQDTPCDVYFGLREISSRLKSGEDLQRNDPIFYSFILMLDEALDESA